MRAAWFDEFGAARQVLRVGDLERPAAGPGEVLVRLATSAVNPSDVKKRAGAFPDLLDGGFVVPNSDGAGTIEAVGDGISNRRIGERVWVYQAQFERRFGTAAEYIAIDAARAPALPVTASFEVGACLGIPAMTAHRCVFADGDVAGRTVLVTGGAGRVGYYAVQWASRAGATVIATASNDADRAACESAGAQHVVDHRGDNVVGDIMAATGGTPIDRIVDVEFGGNLPTSVEVIAVGGTIAAYSSMQVSEPVLPFFRLMYKDITVRTVIVYAMPEAAKTQAVADIDRALKNSRLRHRIADTLPLDDIARANEIVEQGKVRGAVVLTLD